MWGSRRDGMRARRERAHPACAAGRTCLHVILSGLAPGHRQNSRNQSGNVKSIELENDVNDKGVQRNIRIDSTKGALILLVVFGHLLEVFVRDPLYRAIYSAIYLFHMPLFVMISGMFSRAPLGDRDYAGILTKLVIPLVLFQFLYLLPTAIKSGPSSMLSLQPYWLLWFLLALIIWKLALPGFVQLPYPVALAVILALAAGFSTKIGYAFSLSRTLYFFPFFLVGFLYRDWLAGFPARHRGALAALFAATLAAVMTWSFNGLPYQALWGSMSYALAPVAPEFPATGRLLVLLLSFVSCVAFLAVVNESRALAYLGSRSMAIYLLHGFAIKAMASLAYRFSIRPEPYLLPAWLGLAAAISLAFAPLDKWLLDVFGRMSAMLLKRSS